VVVNKHFQAESAQRTVTDTEVYKTANTTTTVTTTFDIVLDIMDRPVS